MHGRLNPTWNESSSANLLDDAGATRNRDVLADIFRTAYDLGTDDADRLDLKITRDALKEMRDAFRLFAPYSDVRKVTVFGSARTRPTDPLYAHARSLAERLADVGWMVVTGAGPGIMAAATEGAGADRSLGVTIRLPFEESQRRPAGGLRPGRQHEVLLHPQAHADEGVERLRGAARRVRHAGRDARAAHARADGQGHAGAARAARRAAARPTGRAGRRSCATSWSAPGWVSPDDVNLFTITDDVDEAVDAIRGFWRNYQGIRWVGDRLVVRLRAEPTDAEVAALDEEFADLVLDGRIERPRRCGAEVSDGDVPRPAPPGADLRRPQGRPLPRHDPRAQRLGSAPPLEASDGPPPGS